MRIVAEASHPDFKITIFVWNQKYLIKLEQPGLEQTFKVNELDVNSDDVLALVRNEAFATSARQRFDEMRASLKQALPQS